MQSWNRHEIGVLQKQPHLKENIDLAGGAVSRVGKTTYLAHEFILNHGLDPFPDSDSASLFVGCQADSGEFV